MNRKIKIKIKITCIAGLLLACSSVFATSIVQVSFNPVDTDSLSLGVDFSINITGSFNAPDFVDPFDGMTKDNKIIGGAFNLSFDPTVLALQSVDVNDSITDFGEVIGGIDNVTGTLGETGFITFAGADDTFVIATLDFTTLGVGVSDLVLTDPNSLLFEWASTGDLGDVTPVFSSGSVAVVPLPAAIFMFPAAIGMLFGFARRG